MQLLKLILIVFALFINRVECLGQGWLDVARNALPRINVGGPAGIPNMIQPQPGFPSTQFDASGASYTSNVPMNTGFGPMTVPNQKDWKLGVYVQNTDIGVVVTQVAPGSAGQQAGIVPNDVIVAVGGSRIGSFDNRIVELADEIRRNTDFAGRVTLLIFDSRQQRLQSRPVSMNSTSSTMTGSVVVRDRIQLPYGSVLTVQLQNSSNPYYEIAGGKSVSRADGIGPFGFELNIDPRYLDPRDQYQIYASIASGTQELYRMPQPIAVNPSSLLQPINLALERSNGVPFGNSNGAGFPSTQGNVINAGYPGTDSNALTQLFLQLLGRSPSAREVIAWQSYLQQGNSIDDLKIKLLSSPQFRERFRNDSAYVQQLVTSVTNRTPNQQEAAFWMGRLQSSSPEIVIGEMLLKGR